MKKFISLILLAAMLASSVICASCAEKANSDETAETPAVSVSEETEEDTKPKHKVPDDLDFDGASFTASYFPWQGYNHYFFAEEETGDAMNDSIYRRKIYVEEYLNVKIGQKDSSSYDPQVADVKQSISAGDDAYQVVLTHCIGGVSEFGASNYMYNLDDLEYINYDADWWNHRMMDVLRLGSRTIFGVSDYMLPCPYTILYNKDTVAQYNMENPYDAVYNGSWTVDKFLEMAVSATVDISGDGKITGDDIRGIGFDECSKMISFMTGSDQFMTSRDEDNHLYLDMNTEKMVDLVTKFTEAVKTDGVFSVKHTGGGVSTEGPSFASGHLMFLLTAMSELGNFRDAEIDIGVLPYPKYNEEQSDYISLDWGGLMCVPGTVKNPDMVGAVLELLAYKSGDTVIPTYYDIMLDGKLARDEDSIKIFDILFDTIAYEVGGNYFGFSSGTYNLFFALPFTSLNSNSNFASFYSKNEKSANRVISKFYETLEEVENG